MLADTRIRWGLPDWVNGEYLKPHDTMRRWGWEFLRRRKDYRELWLACEHRAEPTANGPLTAVTPDYEATRRRYNMSRVVDPRVQLSDWDCAFLFYHSKPFGYEVGYVPEQAAKANYKARKTAIMFDLRRPLAPQLEAARDYLERIQIECVGVPKSPKNRVEKWPLFLRVLDARECGCDVCNHRKNAVAEMEKPPQSARDLHSAAQAVQQRAPFFL
jgi:hypothetical protein